MTSSLSELWELESTSLVVCQKDKVKRNLFAFSEDLLHQLATCNLDPNNNDCANSIPKLFNNAALVQFQAGEVERAEELCRHAIMLYGSLKEGSTGWMTSMIQPYINLGRVAAARGDIQQSIECYISLVRSLQYGEPLVIEPFVISASEFKLILAQEPDIETVITSVYVFDSIKAFLICKDYQGLITFLDHIESASWLNDSFSYCAAKEARAHALIGLECFNEALKILNALNGELNRQARSQPGIYIIMSDIYRRCNKLQQARKVLEFIAPPVEKMINGGANNLAAQHTLYLLALGQYSVQEYDGAHRNAMTALAMAKGLGDEVGMLKCLILLLNISLESSPKGNVDDTSWCAELRQMADYTSFRFERAVALLQVGRALLSSNPEVGLNTLKESLELFGLLHLAGCEGWKQRVMESLQCLSSGHSVDLSHMTHGQVRPEATNSIDTLYHTFKRLDCGTLGVSQARTASALSFGG
jgi:tetratricopeptide (TPR) repeat protein